MSKIEVLKRLYDTNKLKSIGKECICPSCKTIFIKETYQQIFCKTFSKTICKDFYWNNVTPNKRNNKTRISPASARYMNNPDRVTGHTSEGYEIIDGVAYNEFDEPMYEVDPYNDTHPFDLE